MRQVTSELTTSELHEVVEFADLEKSNTQKTQSLSESKSLIVQQKHLTYRSDLSVNTLQVLDECQFTLQHVSVKKHNNKSRLES